MRFSQLTTTTGKILKEHAHTSYLCAANMPRATAIGLETGVAYLPTSAKDDLSGKILEEA